MTTIYCESDCKNSNIGKCTLAKIQMMPYEGIGNYDGYGCVEYMTNYMILRKLRTEMELACTDPQGERRRVD